MLSNQCFSIKGLFLANILRFAGYHAIIWHIRDDRRFDKNKTGVIMKKRRKLNSALFFRGYFNIEARFRHFVF